MRVDPGAVDAVYVDRYGRVAVILQSGRELVVVKPGDVPPDRRPLGHEDVERIWRQLVTKPA
jgi:hypothetical protein